MILLSHSVSEGVIGIPTGSEAFRSAAEIGAMLLLHGDTDHPFLSIWTFVVLGTFAAFYYTSVGVNSRIHKSLIKTIGEVAGASVSIKEALLPMRRGGLTCTGIRIQNPSNFRTVSFISIGKARADISLGTILRELVEIQTISLVDLDVHLDERPWLPDGVSMRDAISQKNRDNQSSERRYVVQELEISNMIIHIPGSILGEEEVTRNVDELRIHNLSGQKDLPLHLLIADILDELLIAVDKSVRQEFETNIRSNEEV